MVMMIRDPVEAGALRRGRVDDDEEPGHAKQAPAAASPADAALPAPFWAPPQALQHNPLADLPPPVLQAPPPRDTTLAAPAPAGPTASAQEVATLELMLADPLNSELVAAYGGGKPALGGNGVADGLLQRYGADLAGRLQQLAHAHAAVRDEFVRAADAAAAAGTWMSEGDAPGFDAAAFTQNWLQSGSLAARAWAATYGTQAPTRVVNQNPNREEDPHWVFAQQGTTALELRVGYALYGGGKDGSLQTGFQPGRLDLTRTSLATLDVQSPPELQQPGLVWFDPTWGFVTDAANFVQHTSFMDRAMPVLVGAMAAWVVGPYAANLGAAVGGAVGSAAVGTAVTAGAVAATASIASQMAATGGVDFRTVLRSALTGAATAGITDALGLSAGQLKDASFVTRTLALTGRATLQGALQAISGGHFKDGFTTGMATGLASELGRAVDLKLAEMLKSKELDAAQAGALRLLSQATGSAIRALANPDDPRFAFASEFLSTVVTDALPQPPAATAGPGQTASPSSDGAATPANPSEGEDTTTAPDAAPPATGTPTGSTPQVVVIQGSKAVRDAQGNVLQIDGQGNGSLWLKGGGVVILGHLEPTQAAELQSPAALAGSLAAMLSTDAGRATVADGLSALGRSAQPWLERLSGLGGRAVGIGAGLALYTGDAGVPDTTLMLGSSLRYVAAEGLPFGVLEERQAGGSWQVVKENVSLYNVSGRVVALTDEERVRYNDPLVNTPPPERPGGSPPLPAWADKPDPAPGFGAGTQPELPTSTVLPIPPQRNWRDLIITANEQNSNGFYGDIPPEDRWRYDRYLNETNRATPLDPDSWYRSAQQAWANNSGGNDFELAVRERLRTSMGPGSKPVSIDGYIPDLPVGSRYGVTDVKNWIDLTNTDQLRAFYHYAADNQLPLNIIISPRTETISEPLLNNIRATGGAVTQYDPATNRFTHIDIGNSGPWTRKP